MDLFYCWMICQFFFKAFNELTAEFLNHTAPTPDSKIVQVVSHEKEGNVQQGSL